MADALLDACVTRNKEDAVLPPANTLLTPDMHVYASYARRINLWTRNDET